MFHRMNALGVLTMLAAALPLTPAIADTVTYDFTSAATAGATTPMTITGTSVGGVAVQASFSSPADPSGYLFTPNYGLYTNLGANLLQYNGMSTAGSPLDIGLSTGQYDIGFNFALTSQTLADPITVTVNGQSYQFLPNYSGDVFATEGHVNFASATAFNSVVLSSPDAIAISDLTTDTAPAPVPLPGTLVLLGGGLAGLAFRARRKSRQ